MVLPEQYLSKPIFIDENLYSPKCNTLISIADDGNIHLPKANVVDLSISTDKANDSKASKHLGSTYLPRDTDPFDDMVTAIAFTGTIVIFMLITLAYLVYKRKNRFERLLFEL